jgi:predicted GNAT family acetyltransferase
MRRRRPSRSWQRPCPWLCQSGRPGRRARGPLPCGARCARALSCRAGGLRPAPPDADAPASGESRPAPAPVLGHDAGGRRVPAHPPPLLYRPQGVSEAPRGSSRDAALPRALAAAAGMSLSADDEWEPHDRAYLSYALKVVNGRKVMDMQHTWTPEALRGQGIAGRCASARPERRAAHVRAQSLRRARRASMQGDCGGVRVLPRAGSTSGALLHVRLGQVCQWSARMHGAMVVWSTPR